MNVDVSGERHRPRDPDRSSARLLPPPFLSEGQRGQTFENIEKNRRRHELERQTSRHAARLSTVVIFRRLTRSGPFRATERLRQALGLLMSQQRSLE